MREGRAGARALPAARWPQLLFPRRPAMPATWAELGDEPLGEPLAREDWQVQFRPATAAWAVASQLVPVPGQVSQGRQADRIDVLHARSLRMGVAQGVNYPAPVTR